MRDITCFCAMKFYIHAINETGSDVQRQPRRTKKRLTLISVQPEYHV